MVNRAVSGCRAIAGALLARESVCHALGQQFVDAVDLVISDMGHDIFEIGVRIDVIDLADRTSPWSRNTRNTAWLWLCPGAESCETGRSEF